MDLNYLNRIISSYLITVTWAYVETQTLLEIFFNEVFYWKYENIDSGCLKPIQLTF